jgi:hypothetical protein
MSCRQCAERRRALADAARSGSITETIRQAAIGAAEMVGLREKESNIGLVAPDGYVPNDTREERITPGTVHYGKPS